MNAESRKHLWSEVVTQCASMRPRPNERGKAARVSRGTQNSYASMRPRPNERGKSVAGHFTRCHSLGASMRPRPNERGKLSSIG